MARVTCNELVAYAKTKGLLVEKDGSKYFLSQLEYNGSEEECSTIQDTLSAIAGWMYQDDTKGYYPKYKDFAKKCNKVIFKEGTPITIT